MWRMERFYHSSQWQQAGGSISQAKICRLHCRLSLLATIMMLREGQWPIGKRVLLLLAPKTFPAHMSLLPAHATDYKYNIKYSRH